MYPKFIIEDLASAIKELERTYITDNVLFRNRVVEKKIVILRDVGDFIIRGIYTCRKTELFELQLGDYDDMKALVPFAGPLGLKCYGASKDLRRVTSLRRTIDDIIGAEFVPIRSSIETYTDARIVKKLNKGRVSLVNDLQGDWCFIQEEHNPKK